MMASILSNAMGDGHTCGRFWAISDLERLIIMFLLK
jgi:hypothetical protein